MDNGGSPSKVLRATTLELNSTTKLSNRFSPLHVDGDDAAVSSSGGGTLVDNSPEPDSSGANINDDDDFKVVSRRKASKLGLNAEAPVWTGAAPIVEALDDISIRKLKRKAAQLDHSSQLLPEMDNPFWRAYLNRLRVANTEAGVFTLSG